MECNSRVLKGDAAQRRTAVDTPLRERERSEDFAAVSWVKIGYIRVRELIGIQLAPDTGQSMSDLQEVPTAASSDKQLDDVRAIFGALVDSHRYETKFRQCNIRGVITEPIEPTRGRSAWFLNTYESIPVFLLLVHKHGTTLRGSSGRGTVSKFDGRGYLKQRTLHSTHRKCADSFLPKPSRCLRRWIDRFHCSNHRYHNRNRFYSGFRICTQKFWLERDNVLRISARNCGAIRTIQLDIDYNKEKKTIMWMGKRRSLLWTKEVYVSVSSMLLPHQHWFNEFFGAQARGFYNREDNRTYERKFPWAIEKFVNEKGLGNDDEKHKAASEFRHQSSHSGVLGTNILEVQLLLVDG